MRERQRKRLAALKARRGLYQRKYFEASAELTRLKGQLHYAKQAGADELLGQIVERFETPKLFAKYALDECAYVLGNKFGSLVANEIGANAPIFNEIKMIQDNLVQRAMVGMTIHMVKDFGEVTVRRFQIDIPDLHIRREIVSL